MIERCSQRGRPSRSPAGKIVGLAIEPPGRRTQARRRRIPLLLVRVRGLSPITSLIVKDSRPDVAVAQDRLLEPADLVPAGIHSDDRPLAVIVHPQERVASEEDPVCRGDLARAFTRRAIVRRYRPSGS